ncbi:type II CAAX prenyl endopeptidase Rce1 family protein [Streptomyces sp. NPDC085946]|uniref:CPBP family intramembrane glutamic endopeptidase n=1 Tax=Streptomyces sp. NPDC085946 TaxID=3365744 RepID=UPI0037D712E2
MTTPAASTSLPYHRLARLTGRHRWWRPLLGVPLLAGGWLLLVIVVDTVSYAVGTVAGRPELRDGSIDFGLLPTTALELSYIAFMLPLVLLAVRWTERRPAGSVSSVAGRLRWGWLMRCSAVAVPAVALLAVVSFLLPTAEEGSTATDQWVGLPAFLTSMAVLAVFVPLQAAAEEYVFRGWMMQAVGGFLRSPWCAVLPQAVLFAAAHGWGTPWGFADLLVFALVAGWLTIRTGGLEASVALHVMNNLMGFGLAATTVDGLASDETAADLPWQIAAVDTMTSLLYAAAVLWLARRKPPQRLAIPAVIARPTTLSTLPHYSSPVAYAPGPYPALTATTPYGPGPRPEPPHGSGAPAAPSPVHPGTDERPAQ